MGCLETCSHNASLRGRTVLGLQLLGGGAQLAQQEPYRQYSQNLGCGAGRGDHRESRGSQESQGQSRGKETPAEVGGLACGSWLWGRVVGSQGWGRPALGATRGMLWAGAPVSLWEVAAGAALGPWASYSSFIFPPPGSCCGSFAGFSTSSYWPLSCEAHAGLRGPNAMQAGQTRTRGNIYLQGQGGCLGMHKQGPDGMGPGVSLPGVPRRDGA